MFELDEVDTGFFLFKAEAAEVDNAEDEGVLDMDEEAEEEGIGLDL